MRIFLILLLCLLFCSFCATQHQACVINNAERETVQAPTQYCLDRSAQHPCQRSCRPVTANCILPKFEMCKSIELHRRKKRCIYPVRVYFLTIYAVHYICDAQYRVQVTTKFGRNKNNYLDTIWGGGDAMPRIYPMFCGLHSTSLYLCPYSPSIFSASCCVM